MGKEMNITRIRDNFIEQVRAMFEQNFDSDCFVAGSGILAMPGVDDEGNEFFYKIQISVPRGSRSGDGGYIPWDAYADKEEYELKIKEKEDKKAAREAEKKRKEEERQRKQAAKKIIKKLNEKGFNALVHEDEGAE